MINYDRWAANTGRYRWIRKDGNPRTYYPLDHNWANVYNEVTLSTDLYFLHRILPEEYLGFTDKFLSYVPFAWFRFKKQLELISGNLEGNNINPDEFYAGYTRTTSGWDTSDIFNEIEDILNRENDMTLGARLDFTTAFGESKTDNKGRTIQYNQGVEAMDDLPNVDIGKYGRDYASGMVDAINPSNTEINNDSETSIGKQDNRDVENSNRKQDSKGNVDNKRGETVEERRINFYDHLAFDRDGFDRLGKLVPFWEYFEPLFARVRVIEKKW